MNKFLNLTSRDWMKSKQRILLYYSQISNAWSYFSKASVKFPFSCSTSPSNCSFMLFISFLKYFPSDKLFRTWLGLIFDVPVLLRSLKHKLQVCVCSPESWASKHFPQIVHPQARVQASSNNFWQEGHDTQQKTSKLLEFFLNHFRSGSPNDFSLQSSVSLFKNTTLSSLNCTLLSIDWSELCKNHLWNSFGVFVLDAMVWLSLEASHKSTLMVSLDLASAVYRDELTL